MSDFAKLTDEELEAKSHELQAAIFDTGEELQAVADERHKRGAEARTAQLLDGMAPGDLDVLVQAAAAKLAAGSPTPGEEE